MKTLKRYTILYLQYIKNHIIGIIEYKLDFFLGLVSMIFEQVLGLISITVIFSNITMVKGWSFGEILFIFGVTTLGRSIHLIFFDNLWAFSWKYIRPGQFDRLLVRPVNPLFQIIAERLHFVSFGQLAVGVFSLVYASSLLGMTWGIGKILMLIVMIVSSGMIFVGIHLVIMTLSFWMINSDPIVYGVFNLSSFTQYPLNIFPRIIGGFLTVVIPYAFTSFIPASFFFERAGNEFYWILSFVTPAVSVLLCFLAYRFWLFGIKRYTSAGN